MADRDIECFRNILHALVDLQLALSAERHEFTAITVTRHGGAGIEREIMLNGATVRLNLPALLWDAFDEHDLPAMKPADSPVLRERKKPIKDT